MKFNIHLGSDIFFGYNLSFDANVSLETESPIILLEESNYDFSSNDFCHKIKLYNNQDRVVNIISDKSFDILVHNQSIIFTISDVANFKWEIGTDKICYYKKSDATDELIKYWLLHTVIPLMFTFNNKYYILHAGAIELEDNNVILFVADSYGGKSTLTDYFIQKNHIMLSDDKVAVSFENNQIYATPSYPYHRPYRKVEDLGKRVEKFSSGRKKIKAIYNLIGSKPDANISISKVSGIEKFKVLRSATDIDIYMIYKKERFDMLAKISNNTNIFDITIPWDLNRLEEVYQAIIEHNK